MGVSSEERGKGKTGGCGTNPQGNLMSLKDDEPEMSKKKPEE